MLSEAVKEAAYEDEDEAGDEDGAEAENRDVLTIT